MKRSCPSPINVNNACIGGKCNDPLTLYDCGPGYCNRGFCSFDNHYLEQDEFTCQCFDHSITSTTSNITTQTHYGAPSPLAYDGYGAPAPADDGYGAPAPADDGYGAPAPADDGYGAPPPPFTPNLHYDYEYYYDENFPTAQFLDYNITAETGT